ncbi:MAG: 2-C-methyl-D-erythritol 4-phosphate cytidylyltransferase [Bacteroidetes bacterium]|nr:2-C-methyl-D-erythritol 4-phosphate cytidylyltransferase [Bacteroidota bacterium]MBS1541380.1 2-C-methyl-D-erythritol 4-phosphate cytidylyltransferase [Bacteroidota bacterium]
METKEYALIVAGGRGKRMNHQLPKQFIRLNGKPILLYTVEAFFNYSEKIEVVLVLPENEFDFWYALCREFGFTKPVILQKGGESRFQSVKNGLEKIDDHGLVAIHDGVRPLVNVDLIGASFRLAAVHGSAVASVRLKESLRETDQQTTQAVDRSRFRLIQTPQTFQVSIIKKAYQQKEDPTLTDDASVAERSGHRISLFEGSYDNLKITTPEDLIVAEALLKARG